MRRILLWKVGVTTDDVDEYLADDRHDTTREAQYAEDNEENIYFKKSLANQFQINGFEIFEPFVFYPLHTFYKAFADLCEQRRVLRVKLAMQKLK